MTATGGTRPILRMSTCVNTRERPSFHVLLRRQYTRRSSTSAAASRQLHVLPRRVYTTVYTSLAYRLTTKSAYPRSGEHIYSSRDRLFGHHFGCKKRRFGRLFYSGVTFGVSRSTTTSGRTLPVQPEARSRRGVVSDDGWVDPRRPLASLTLLRILAYFRISTLYIFVYVSLEKITDLGDSFSNANISLFSYVYQNGKSAYLITVHFQVTVSNLANLPSTLRELQDLAVFMHHFPGGVVAGGVAGTGVAVYRAARHYACSQIILFQHIANESKCFKVVISALHWKCFILFHATNTICVILNDKRQFYS